jgi:hypothetical protein
MITFSQLGKHGEFGNQLFQIAATIGFATKLNTDYLFPLWKGLISQEEYGKYFENPIPQISNLPITKYVYNEPHFHYAMMPSTNENTDIFGYFQSEKYFKHCESLIRKVFKPSKLLKNIDILNYKDTICIQIRFYDNQRPYSTHSLKLDPEVNNFYYQPEENLEYFKKAINFFGKNKTFLICTNNPNKAEQMFGSYDNFYILKNYSYMEQFFIQTKCEHNIISNSSFGWWGAWLNCNPNKIVFAPSKWFKDEKMLTNDLYPKEWKII